MTIQEARGACRSSPSDCRNDIADLCHPQASRPSVIAIRCRHRWSPRSAGCWIGRRCSSGLRMTTVMSAGARSGRISRRPAPNTARDWSTRCWRRCYRGFAASEPVDVFEKLTQAHRRACLAVRRARSVRAGDRGHRSGGVGSLCAAPQHRAVEAARRQQRPDPGLCQRHQSDRFAADGRSGAEQGASRTEAEDRLRSCRRLRQPDVASRAGWRRHARRRCQPGAGRWSRRWRSHPHLGRIRSRLARRADPRRSAVAGMARVAQGIDVPLAAGENIASHAGFAASDRRATCCASFSPISPNGVG